MTKATLVHQLVADRHSVTVPAYFASEMTDKEARIYEQNCQEFRSLNCSRLVPYPPGFDRTMIAHKTVKISHFRDILGCPRKNKWCPEEDSNLHALASAST
jgi:hypothetical protein